MNYKKIYGLIINKAQHRVLDCYIENHHIIPKCIDKSKEFDKDNLAKLTAREHFIVHKLLVKMYPDSRELKFAIHFMTLGNQGRKLKLSARDFEYARKMNYEANKGRKMGPCSGETRRKISEALKGKKRRPQSKEHREKLSKALKGRKMSEEWKQKISLGVKLQKNDVK